MNVKFSTKMVSFIGVIHSQGYNRRYTSGIPGNTFHIIHTIIAHSIPRKKLNLASSPPTASADVQMFNIHSLRVYFHVQTWLSTNLSSTDWGWKNFINGLLPIANTSELAPSNVLELIFGICKGGCLGLCGCRRVGIQCSHACSFKRKQRLSKLDKRWWLGWW